ncbi:uncharacterized protein LOC134738022 isoform X3 [Pongo pygmaeus]|uniref:uncharacterized protein LOC134738022 isoform X3 n=1 Tax=Pongo pygmaeus TaxID=9600 RepID=UPI00300D2092
MCCALHIRVCVCVLEKGRAEPTRPSCCAPDVCQEGKDASAPTPSAVSNRLSSADPSQAEAKTPRRTACPARDRTHPGDPCLAQTEARAQAAASHGSVKPRVLVVPLGPRRSSDSVAPISCGSDILPGGRQGPDCISGTRLAAFRLP